MTLMNEELKQDREECKLSREEIENLCILHAVGEIGCPSEALAGRLGLSEGLKAAVASAVQTIVARGWLVQELDRLVPSPAGNQWLRERQCIEARSDPARNPGNL